MILKDEKLNKDFLRSKARKPEVTNIAISIIKPLSQLEFNEVVYNIGQCTNKPTVLSFRPMKGESETPADAYARYAANYISKNPRNMKEFPEHLYVRNVFIEEEQPKKRAL